MSFDYEKSVWGRGTASTKISDPTSIRLGHALRALKILKSGDKVLEIGCGAGQFIRGIKLIRPELICQGVDISVNAINAARETKDGVEYFCQTGELLPRENNFFDAVIILDVLEHVENWQQILSEAQRVLKPGGVLYIFVPCEGSKVSFWNWLRKLNIGKNLTNKYAGHINYFSKNDILITLNKFGFNYSIKYSEHVLGQLIGIAAFFAMEAKAKKQTGKQINNEQFFTENNESAIIKFFKKCINGLVYIESLILQYIPSPNLHITAIKPK
ncbi:MAG: class I SAM-dependent methyltransferase [Patescibacteria group bacterium]|jgi:ubiquinone/menaquinone biosynthesis C-methylase UbiE